MLAAQNLQKTESGQPYHMQRDAARPEEAAGLMHPPSHFHLDAACIRQQQALEVPARSKRFVDASDDDTADAAVVAA